MIRVLLADDHPVVRTGYRRLLERILRLGLDYRAVKRMTRDSLTHAFLPGQSLFTDPSRSVPPAPVQPPTDPVAEQRAYDLGLEQFRAGRFGEAIATFQAFIRNFPRSTLVPSAQYWIGNSLYATRDYRGAIAAQRQLLSQHPDSAKASDALLNIATAQSDLGELQAARASLQEVISKYPSSEAATKARQRLGVR